jgi:Ca2+-binding RTX toxin-like protein
MAKVWFYQSTDMLNLDWAFGFPTDTLRLKATNIKWGDDTQRVTYRGDFVYDSNATNSDVLGLKSGMLTGYELYENQILRVTMTGLSFDAVSAFIYMEQDDPLYDLELLEQLLSKGDQITGSFFDDILYGFGGNDSINGGRRHDTLYGNDGTDRLNGAAGNDVLIGGKGSDTLIGGNGKDKFVFDSALKAANIDSILDFVTADDTIQLDNLVFTAFAAEGLLAGSAFTTGTEATDANHRIIFDSATGALFYDADGLGGNAAVQFATIAGIEGALSASDFEII